MVFGYGDLGAAAVETLAAAEARIIGLVVPSNRIGRDIDTVRACAATRGIPVLVQPPRGNIEPFVDDLKKAAPDLIVVWSYSMILPSVVIAVPQLGCVNVHGGLLPSYRGAHVMQWAIINGENETGVTLHYVDAGIDTGPVIAQARFPLEWEDDAVSVQGKLKATGSRLLREWWPSIVGGTAPRTPQNESRAKCYPLRNPQDGLINWSSSAASIYNLVRALVAPWPGAFTVLRGRRVVVRRVQILDWPAARLAPGSVSGMDERGVRVRAGDRDVLIVQGEVDGVVLGPKEWSGLNIDIGDQFGS